MLTLSSSLLYLGQTGSLVKKSNLFRHARDWQRISQRLERILPIIISPEVFLHTKTDSWEAQSSSFCCPGKDSAQRRAGEVLWEETAGFTQRNPPQRWSLSISRHNISPGPSLTLKQNTQEHKMSSGGSGIAFLSPPIHCLTCPISQVHNPYQPRNESHENSAGGGRNIWATYCTCH